MERRRDKSAEIEEEKQELKCDSVEKDDEEEEK